MCNYFFKPGEYMRMLFYRSTVLGFIRNISYYQRIPILAITDDSRYFPNLKIRSAGGSVRSSQRHWTCAI